MNGRTCFFLMFALPLLFAWQAACGGKPDPDSATHETPAVLANPGAPDAAAPLPGRTSPSDAPSSPNDAGAAGTTPNAEPAMSAALPACDRYIRYICSCAKKHSEPELKQACELANRSLPEWQSAHRGEGEELAVTKACHRAFLYIQASGRCEDVEP